jgi:L-aspartate oxidase
MNQTSTCFASDVLIIGAGAAGLTLALCLAEAGIEVIIVSKSDLNEGSTRYAQGGMAAVLDAADSFDAHIQDTLIAGQGLCHPDIVEMVVHQAPSVVDWLLKQGVLFSTESANKLHLHQEGGHSFRRIIHAADATGKAISKALTQKVEAHPLIKRFEHHLAIDFQNV